MTPLDQASRDRIIEHLAYDLEDCIFKFNGDPSAKDLATCALTSMESLPPMLERLQDLAQKAIRANRSIRFAQNFYPKDRH
jgi:hypothetical protein